ncbi:vegetative incompatibility protein HET-E-1 [Xylaria telfairii]|nr:vegetative incompatibility protein HET-E-1 [Xylaria telfairii]
MRLLNRDHATGAITLTEDLHSGIPPYAILSHRWGPDEVTLQAFQDGTGLGKQGYEKIRFCGEQAQRDGLSHFWVDTCCIDKRNAVELQAAITSMFRWYQNAKRCYVYLDDVSYPPTPSAEHLESPPAKRRKHTDTTVPTEPPWYSAFRNSIWFTRGWTLQELLAPTSVEFFSREHTLLGNKRSLEGVIWDITRIPVEALRNCPPSDFSVSDRFSWMEHRETTVEEDKAYAMLGIFSVQIPLIYGEGYANASQRLRREVSQATKLPSIPVAEGAAFDSRAEEHNARCFPDTRVDLLREITSWAIDPDGKAIFWLNGIAGTGKSTISRTVAQRFHDRGLLGASFFFKRGEAERGHAGRLFTTLAAQLAVKVPRVAQQIQTALDIDPNVCSKALSDQFQQLILNALAYARGPQTLVIVIDALDECDKDADIRAIIHLLSQVKAMPHVRLRTLLTSRPELPIRLGFRKVQGGYQDLVLHDMPQEIVTHDLRIFFKIELARIQEEYNDSSFEDVQLPPDWPSQHIDTLVSRAYPLFIIAATMCRFLEPARFNPDDQLSKLLHYHAIGHTSDQLQSTYLPILNQLISEQTVVNKQRLLDGFRDIVGTIVLLTEPLSARALSGILQISLPIIQNQLKLLHSVLAVPSISDGPIRTFHLSFRDFLLDPSRQDTHEFWIDEQLTHKKLAARCIQLLSTSEILKKDICNLCAPAVSLSQVDRQAINRYLPSEVQYACRYWVHHLESSGTSIQDYDQVYVFLHTHFLHWLEALCLLGSIHSSLGMLKTLRDRCKRGTCIDKFIQDADRFIRYFIDIIALHPLQLYCSAICFAPQKSVIRQEFQKEMSTRIIKPPSMPDAWNACIQTLEGHNHWVHFVAISPDGSWLASGSNDKTIKMWDVLGGICTQTFEGHEGGVNSIAISPDSRWLASGSEDKTIKIWDVAKGVCTQMFEGHKGGVDSIAISPDGSWLASGSRDKTVKIWDVARATCTQTLEVRPNWVYSIAISPDGRWLVLALSEDINIWDITTGVCHRTMTTSHSVRSIAISPDSRWVASSKLNAVQIWDLVTGACKKTIMVLGYAFNIAISPDSCWLALGVFMGIDIWDIETGTCIQTFESYGPRIRSVAISPDGRWLASGSTDKNVRIWDIGIKSKKKQFHSSDVLTLLSPDGRWIVLKFGDRAVKIWDVVTGTYSHTFEGQYESIAISPDSYWLALGPRNETIDKAIEVREIATGTLIQTLRIHDRLDDIAISPIHDRLDDIAISPNKHWLVSVFKGGRVRIWDLTKGTYAATLKSAVIVPTHIKQAEIAISPDSCWLVLISGGWSSTIQIWDLATITFQHGLDRFSSRLYIQSITISFDSRWLVVGFDLGTIGIWDITSSTWKQWLGNYTTDSITTVCISPNSCWIASWLGETIEIWDIITGTRTQRFDMGKSIFLKSLAFESNTTLRTQFGYIKLGPAAGLTTYESHTSKTLPSDINTSRPSYQGYGIDTTLEWITWDGQKVMWLPPEYRPKTYPYTWPPTWIISSSTMAIVCVSGEVIVFQLSANNPLGWSV